MANRYGGITGSKKISEDWDNINRAFDNVQADVDAKATTVNSHIANADIHVTAAKKAEWDGHVSNADIHVTAAQKAAWDTKADGSTAAELADHVADQVVHVTQADHDKLASIEDGAQVNQNAFSKVNDIEAADPSSQFYIVGGIGITVTTNPNSGEVTVTATGDAAPGAHGSTHTEHGADPIPTATLTEGGLLSAAQLAEIVAHGELLDEHAAAITDLEDRLDIAEVTPLTLQPGLQVVTAVKDARFRLGEIRGKTEINGQGRIGLIGVENPYAVATSGNLLPPFCEWTLIASNAQIREPYTLELNAEGASSEPSQATVPVLPNTTYTLSSETGRMYYNLGTSSGPIRGIAESDGGSVTFTTPSNAEVLSIQCLNLLSYTDINDPSTFVYGGGKFTFKKPMLVIGPNRNPFQPQRSSMLAFQTELHASPMDGSDPDVLFEQDGEYRKLAKWKKVALDGSLVWYYDPVSAPKPGMKRVYTELSAAGVPLTGFSTKYGGTQMVNSPDFDAVDQFTVWTSYVYVSIANSDSGWGDDYTPTQDEIKAYFNGWKMYTGTGEDLPYYDGAAKYWRYINIPVGEAGIIYGSATDTLPTTMIPNYTPYNLLYRLAKETAEPVTSEGCLTLSEGENMLEVGTGIVLRERANPVQNGPHYNVNNVAYPASLLKNKTERIIAFYKNNHVDPWGIFTPLAYGNEGLYTEASNFDQSAAYSVTYTKLDKSPIVPITGMMASNEKTQLSDLTAGVAEALHRTSVLEQKKAEKDAPGWLIPTLLNGWMALGTDEPIPSFQKDSGGKVYIKGAVKSGAIGTPIFLLPSGYRPKQTLGFAVTTFDGAADTFAKLVVNKDGGVFAWTGSNVYISLNLPPFLAEQ
ncbi:hypothetical protein [Paenibacillus fonticola]|uniref:hypothetical protein n=1 Tax=Paenibacillus fonticola TaxID=379896 RepID=UPI00036221E3|nr:hypothetical protein [Paenibacillus fonticola]